MVTSTIAGAGAAISHWQTGAGLHEYLLVVNPDAVVKNRVMAEKQSFYDKYLQPSKTASQPHIVVASYRAKEEMEATIERWVQRICAERKSFRVVLNNFSGFPHGTLYIRVQNPQPIHALLQQLKVIDNYISVNSGYPVSFNDRPHLKIAGRLPDDVYTRALFDYAQRDFHESFVVNELLLLKRESQGGKCQLINVFRLLPEVDETTYSTQLHMF